MSVFIPFKAFRPLPELVEKVASKPYDVLNTQEAKEEAAGNDISFYHVIKPEIDFHDDQDPFAKEVYLKGKDNLERLIDDGIIVQDKTENFYVYRIRMGNHEQTGLVGCCSIDDYFDNVIKKHELTKPKIEASRKKHIMTSKFAYEPVFFSYPKVESIDSIIKPVKDQTPLYDFHSSEGTQHTVWSIDNPDLTTMVTEIFEIEIPTLYIADGHHRTAAGALAGRELRSSANGNNNNRYGYLMCVAFPHDQVQILEYNRAVKGLNGLSPEEFMDLVETNFIVEKKQDKFKPESDDSIGMYVEGQWYKLTIKEDRINTEDLIDRLGFTTLSKYILEPILNIVDLRRDDRIDFIGGIRGLEELERKVDSGQMEVAFSMFPISMEQLMEIADNNLLLPPKVTWFEPKLKSGLFVHSLENEYKSKMTHN